MGMESWSSKLVTWALLPRSSSKCVIHDQCAFVDLLILESLFFLSRQGFSVALEPVLKLALVEEAGLELTEIHLPLPPKCWD